MSEFQPFILILVLVAFGFAIWLALLPLWMYNRVKGIERAMWAVVSQLQAMRREEHNDVDPAATRRAREVREAPGMVSNSMFGR